MQLTEKMYWYPWQGRANNCNSYLFRGEKTILFDPGHIRTDFGEDCVDMLTRGLEKDKIKPEEIDYVLCTHGHPDHVESAGLWREKCGAKFGIHKGDQFMLDAIAQHYSTRGAELSSLKPDFYIEEGELKLNGNDQSSTLIISYHTPGHSPGCLCFYLPDCKALVSGDTVFEGSIGRADLPGGDMTTLGQSVDKLSRLEGIELLLPGHMGYVSGAANVTDNIMQIKRFFF